MEKRSIRKMHIVEAHKIDPKLTVRGVSFESLRNLLHNVYQLTPVRYTDALNLVSNKGIILSQKGEKLTKSGFYHYWNALQHLGLIEQSKPLKRYNLTELGHRLINAANNNENRLSDEEQSIFREGILANKLIWENFLFLFTGEKLPNTRPLIGNRVLFVPEGRKSYILKSPFVKEKIILDYSQSLSIIFGLRRWGQQCKLFDEIFLPTSNTKYPAGTSFMYLLDFERTSITNDEFTEFISKNRSQATSMQGTTLKFNISLLLTEICIQEGLLLEVAQSKLREWLNKHKFAAAVERPSQGLIEEQRGMRNRDAVRRKQPWFYKDGHTYTTLLLQENVLNLGE